MTPDKGIGRLDWGKGVKRIGQSAFAWGLVFTALRGVGFLGVMAYALRKISTQNIGLWYVMLNISGLAAVVELGFAVTIGRYASCFSGGMTEIPQFGLGSISPEAPPHWAGIRGLIQMARVLYRTFAILMLGVMLVLWGIWMWRIPSAPAIGSSAMWQFLVLFLGTAINMTGFFWPAVLMGMNEVRRVNQYMAAGLVIGYAVTGLGLLAGWGLWALIAGQILIAVFPRLASRVRVRALIPPLSESPLPKMSWRSLWPVTWRAGLITLAMNLCVQATTLICSWVTDLETTAKYGISLQLALMLHQVAALWLVVKMPQISILQGRGEWTEVHRLVKQRLGLTLATYGLGMVALLWLGSWVLVRLGSHTTLLASGPLVLMFTWIGMELFVGFHSAIVLTGNTTPHLASYVIAGLAAVILGVMLGRQFGVYGIMMGSILAQVGWNYWWVPRLAWRQLGRPLVRV